MENVLITGGTGLIGSKLSIALTHKGYSVSILSRNNFFTTGMKVYKWNISKSYIETESLKNTEHIIHLAGANVADGRWTEERKKEIVKSRILSTRVLFDNLKKNKYSVRTLISASAIGIYGDQKDKWLEEQTSPTNDFLGNTCALWENEVRKFEELGIRTVILRIGVVLSNKGGALPKMIKPIKNYCGAPLGDGCQYMSWIHLDDLVNIFLWFLKKNNLSGTFNAVSPNPVTNAEFTNTLAGFLNRKIIFPGIPSSILKLIFGEMSSILLNSIRVSPQKLLDTGFKFNFPDLYSALKEKIYRQNMKKMEYSE